MSFSIINIYYACAYSLTVGATAVSEAYFGQGSGPVHFDSLTCNGNETDFLQCSITGGSTCTHSAGVGVQCPGTCTHALKCHAV